MISKIDPNIRFYMVKYEEIKEEKTRRVCRSSLANSTAGENLHISNTALYIAVNFVPIMISYPFWFGMS